jgi:Transposase DDE domain
MSNLNPYSLSLILSEGSFSCVKAANILGFVSHDHLTRQLSKAWDFRPVSDWEKLPKKGRLVLDDSSIAKPHSESIEGVKWIWDSAQNKSVPGINMLLALWVVDEQVFVLELVFPQNENRHDIVQELLKEVHEAGFEPTEVSFDAWYAASKTLNLIHTLGWIYVSRMRSNRVFNGQAIESHSFQGAQGQIGKLKGVYAQVQITKHGDRYLVTNELTPHTSRSLAGRYGERWVVETVFRDLKTVLHLEKCSCRNLEAQFNHVFCVLEAYLHLRQAFPSLSIQAAQQEYLRLYRCPNCRPELTQLVRA